MPAEPWAAEPMDSFGLAYDHVEQHSWYANLDPTVAERLWRKRKRLISAVQKSHA